MGTTTGNPTWQDGEAGGTLITAARLNAMEQAIDDAHTQAINAQTGTTYTLQASDASGLVTLTNAAAITLTVPGATFAAGQRVDISVRGTGMATVVGSSCTVNPPPGRSLVSNGQRSAFTVLFITATEADVIGDMASA